VELDKAGQYLLFFGHFLQHSPPNYDVLSYLLRH
jgi:hypothetical protein